MDISQRQTSIESKRKGEDTGNFQTLRDRLLAYAAARADFTDREAMDYFNQPRSTLSGARNALYLAGWLAPNGTRPDPQSGRNVIAWRYCANPRPVEKLSAKRKVWFAKKAVSDLEKTGFQDVELVKFLTALLNDEPVDLANQRAIIRPLTGE